MLKLNKHATLLFLISMTLLVMLQSCALATDSLQKRNDQVTNTNQPNIRAIQSYVHEPKRKSLSQTEKRVEVYRNEFSRNSPNYAFALNSLVVEYRKIGRYAEAIQLTRQCLEIYEKSVGKKHPTFARSLNNLALLYQITGRYDDAEPLYRRALILKSKLVGKKHPGYAASLNNLAGLYKTIGLYDEAEPLYKEAIAIYQLYQRTNNKIHPDIAGSLSNLAGLYRAMKKYRKAELLYKQAIDIYRNLVGEDHPAFAGALNNLAYLYLTIGRYDEAELLCLQAYILSVTSSLPELQWSVQSTLRDLYAARGQNTVAIFYGKQTVNTLQKTRADLARLELSTQQSFIDAVMEHYTELADLLLSEGRLYEAQQVLAMIKQEEYVHFTRGDRGWGGGIPSNRFELDKMDDYEKIKKELISLGQELETLKKKKSHTDLAPKDERRLKQLIGYKEAANKELRSWVKKTNRELGKLSQADIAVLTEFKLGDNPKLRAMLSKLDKVVLIHYLPTSDKLHILLTTPSMILRREVAVDRKQLNRVILELRDQLKPPSRRRGLSSKYESETSGVDFATSKLLQSSQQLYKWLLQPIAKELNQSGAEVLLVYLYGAMRYLPLGVLHDGKNWMADRYGLAVYTTAAELEQQPSSEWKVAGLGTTKEHFPFPPLPAVARELESIILRNDGDKDGILDGEVYLDESFTLQRFYDVLQKKKFKVLHIASHFYLAGTTEDSFLLLGDGARLSLDDIAVKELNVIDLDLLTLSACNTGIGLNGSGIEVEGLAHVFYDKGARSVLATLWSVSDNSTADFMYELYLIHTTKLVGKAKALQEAKQAFIHAGEPGSSGADFPKYYRHPFHWAPFVLMGNSL